MPDSRTITLRAAQGTWSRPGYDLPRTQGTSRLQTPVRPLFLTSKMEVDVLSSSVLERPFQPPLVGSTEVVSLGSEREDALSDLGRLYQDVATAGWDGYGAQAVDSRTYELARQFFRLLPATIPLPEITADPDGEISFEWFRDRQHVFSASIGPDGRISYAGLFGTGRIRGREYLRSEVPEAIITNVRRLSRDT